MVRNARKITEDLGLNWKDYVRFSKYGKKSLKGKEKPIAKDFASVEYGAAKRDELFKRFRDRMLENKNWTPEEHVFMSHFLNEMSYTIPDAIENTKLLAVRTSSGVMNKMSIGQAEEWIRAPLELGKKFPAANEEIFKSVQEQLKSYVSRSLREDAMGEARAVIPLLNHESQKEILSQVQTFFQSRPKAEKLGIFSDLILNQPEQNATKQYLGAIQKIYRSGTATALPARFPEVALSAKNSVKEVNAAKDVLVSWLSQKENSNLRLSNEDPDLILWLVQERPHSSEALLARIKYRSATG